MKRTKIDRMEFEAIKEYITDGYSRARIVQKTKRSLSTVVNISVSNSFEAFKELGRRASKRLKSRDKTKVGLCPRCGQKYA